MSKEIIAIENIQIGFHTVLKARYKIGLKHSLKIILETISNKGNYLIQIFISFLKIAFYFYKLQPTL